MILIRVVDRMVQYLFQMNSTVSASSEGEGLSSIILESWQYVSSNIHLDLVLLLLHLLDYSPWNCEKLVFHNNGIMMMNLLVTAALGSGELNPVCLQTALFLRVFGFDSTELSYGYAVCDTFHLLVA